METIPVRLAHQAEALGERPALFTRVRGTWEPTSWRQYHERVQQAARSLVALGVEVGGATAVLGFNTEAWVVFDLATMTIGGRCAGIYTTSSPAEVRHIVDHSEATVVLVENRHQWEKIREERASLPGVAKVVTMPGCEPIDDPLVIGWEGFLALGDTIDPSVIRSRRDAVQLTDVATLIYTSGTTGPPKAVMLTHENLAWTASCAVDQIAHMTPDDVLLSYLPLSHIAEQMFTVHAPITSGSTVYFAESIEKLPDNLKEVSPTILFGVPRIWEKFHARVSARLDEATGFKALVADWAMGVGRQVSERRMEGRRVRRLLRVQHAIADRLFYDKVKSAMGLQRARFCVSGAAPISNEVLSFFAGLDLVVQEVYGQSEGCGPTTFNAAVDGRPGTVGKRIPGTQVRIAEDGEILAKGPHVFAGYFKDPVATDEALSDGWLRTGDLGELDADGFLKITGRKKDILITAGGKNIAPKNIESALRDIDIVSQAVVIGDRRKYLGALITLALDEEVTRKLAESNGVALEDLHAAPCTRTYIQRRIDDHVNPQFARVEHIRRFSVLPRDLSIEDGELTPTLKVKRAKVNENWSETIEDLYR